MSYAVTVGVQEGFVASSFTSEPDALLDFNLQQAKQSFFAMLTHPLLEIQSGCIVCCMSED